MPPTVQIPTSSTGIPMLTSGAGMGPSLAMALDAAGFQEVSRLFFQFCDRTVSDKGFFHHKYGAEGSVGSSWLVSVDFQGLHTVSHSRGRGWLWCSMHSGGTSRGTTMSSSWKRFTIPGLEDLGLHPGLHESITGLPKPSFDRWEKMVGIHI